MRGSKGFTLIELVIALAIIGILATLALPDFLGLTDRSRLKRAARDIYTNLQKARMGALKSGARWRVEFLQPDGNSYRIRNSGPDKTLDTNDDVLEVISLTRSEYKGVLFGSAQGKIPSANNTPDDGISFNGNSVLFRPSGTAEGGTVYVKIKTNETFAISVVSATGRVKLWKNFGSGWGS